MVWCVVEQEDVKGKLKKRKKKKRKKSNVDDVWAREKTLS